MTSIKVFGSAQVKSYTLEKYDYTQDVTTVMKAFTTLVSNCKADIYKAFDELCHIAMAQACVYKTQKERHSALQQARDAFFENLPKKYASAFARGITALEWAIPENFEDFFFSDYLDLISEKNTKPKERGTAAIYAMLQKKLEAVEKQIGKIKKANGVLPDYLKEERATYALLIKTHQ